jgi:hypothetical protein
MYRKLVICGMSVLAIMTLVVSAQQPDHVPRQPSNLPLDVPVQPQGFPSSSSMARDFFSLGGRVQQEELEYAQKSDSLVKQLAKAEGEKRDKIKDQLTETLGKQFDARQKRHQAEIAVLEKQLKKLKDLVDKRKENRREIISKRLDQLVRDAEGLGW